MKNYSSLFFLSIVAFLFFSCKKTDITPAFLILHEKDFENCIDVSNFNTVHETDWNDYELQIIGKQNFRDALVSLNGQELGYWQFPCRIPLLPNYSGENNIRITPCVRTPNTTLTTIQYPFVTPVEHFLTLEREGEYTSSNIKIKFEYRKEVKFEILETFVQSTIFSSVDTSRGAPLVISQNDEGKPIGEILLNDSLIYFDVATENIELPPYTSRYFWEISYNCSGEMTTYLRFASGILQKMIVHPSTRGTWKTVYIEVTDILRMAANMSDKVLVSFGIEGLRLQNSPNAYFHFEYIKLISMIAPY
jgi:hypothetical protein